MVQIVPFCAILCHFRTFCKENLYLNRQPLCFHHFARTWPLTSGVQGYRHRQARTEIRPYSALSVDFRLRLCRVV